MRVIATVAANRWLFTVAGAATVLILVLAVVLGILWLRRAKTAVREP